MIEAKDMTAVILAGGFGTRISEESILRPKPMIEIGGRPILWHIMKIYSHYGVKNFIILCGYRGYMIKEYFANYVLHMSDITVDLVSNNLEVHQSYNEPWRVTLLNTGEDTQTGGRIKRATEYLKNEKAFFLTYGDGVADIDIDALTRHHFSSERWVTMTAVQPPGRFGAVELSGNDVTGFKEKPSGESLVNGGFFVLSPKVLEFIDGDHSIWEVDALPKLLEKDQISAYQHQGFWRPMDTLRDKNQLEEFWDTGKAPWKHWS